MAAYAVGQFVCGSAADRFGTRVVVLGPMVMDAAAAITIGLLPALVLSVPLMIVQGLVAAANDTSVTWVLHQLRQQSSR